MNFFKTSILSFIATSFRILSGLLINKAVAVIAGPSGLATLGQLQSAVQIANITAQGGVNNGIVKYLAEFKTKKDENKRARLTTAALKISMLCSGIVSAVLILFHGAIANAIFHSDAYDGVVLTLGFVILFYVLNNFMLSVLNGLKEIKRYITISILQSITALIWTLSCLYFFGFYGGLIAFVTSQSIVFIIVAIWLRKHKIFDMINLREKLDRPHVRNLLKFSAMALTSAILLPLSHIILRNFIGAELSWNDAGIWQGLIQISQTYMVIITTTFSIYYLPKISSLDNPTALRSEIWNILKIIPLFVMASCGAIYILRELIIVIMFNDSFLAMESLFKYQLIGDFFRVSGWIFGYLMVAKAMTKKYIISEIFFTALFVALGIYFVQAHGLIGISYAYMINAMLYLPVVYILTRGIFSLNASR